MIKFYINRFKKNNFWKSVATLTSGQVLAQAINLISTPIISRIYDKEAFGTYGIIISTATIIIGFVGLGLGSAIMVCKDDHESKKVFTSCFYIQALLITLIIVIILSIYPSFKLFQNDMNYYFAICTMYIYIVLAVLSSQLNVYINRLKKNYILFINPLIGTLCTLLIAIPIGLTVFAGYGLILSAILSQIFMILHMLKNENPFSVKIKFADYLFLLKNYKHFIIYQYPSNLMGTFSGQLPNQFIAKRFSITALGDFNMCNKIFYLPSKLIASPIQTIYFRTIAGNFKKEEDIADFTFSIVSKLLLLAFIPCVLLIILGPTIFEFILGSQWKFAGQLASVLSVQYVFSFCYECVTYCRVTIGKQKVNLIISVVQLFMIFCSLFIGSMIAQNLLELMIFYSIINTIFSIMNLSLNFYCLKKNLSKFLIFSTCYCFCLIMIVFISKGII